MTEKSYTDTETAKKVTEHVNIMFAEELEGEKQENCIHCNEKWYSIHYNDGVCNSCQRKGLKGRLVQKKRKEVFVVGVCVILILGILHLTT